MRRVRRLNPAAAPNPTAGNTGKRGELFAVYRNHAVFTDSPASRLAAEATHRDHAIVEQVIAELKNGPLAHLCPLTATPMTGARVAGWGVW